MKSKSFFRQIQIAAVIALVFSVIILAVGFLLDDENVTVMSLHDFQGATAVVYTSEGQSTSADCPIYSLGDGKYIALFDASCSIKNDGQGSKIVFTRKDDACEIACRAKKETRPVESAHDNGKTYEFFGGEISFYPFEQGWISVIFLMNSADNAEYERVRFGSIEMSAKEYHDAYPNEADEFVWDAENEVYVDEMGQRHETRFGAAFEAPVLFRTHEKDAYVSFYLTDADYLCMMKDRIFGLQAADGGRMNALFWEKEQNTD